MCKASAILKDAEDKEYQFLQISYSRMTEDFTPDYTKVDQLNRVRHNGFSFLYVKNLGRAVRQ